MQTNVQIRQVIYNQLPEELEKELEKKVLPKNGVTIRMYNLRTAHLLIPRQGNANTVVEVPNAPVKGLDYLRNKWTIMYKNNTYQVGIVTGNKGDGTPIFAEKAFSQSQMFLTPAKQEDQIIYKYLHLSPEFAGNIIGIKSGFKFYEENPEEDARKESEKFAAIDKAVDYIKGLSDELLTTIGDRLNVSGSKTQIRLALRKLANQEPDRVLATRTFIDNALKEEVLNYAFNLGIVVLDHTNKMVAWGGNNEKLIDYNLNVNDQKMAFIDAMLNSNDPSVKTLYGRIKAQVDQHATSGGLLQELSEKRVNIPKQEKEKAVATITKQALEEL